VGRHGTAVTTLRPSGKADIGGRVYSVETEGTFIEQGERITVVAVHGSRVIVAKEA
jgi:membrane-bound serine protease (ClpP class)